MPDAEYRLALILAHSRRFLRSEAREGAASPVAGEDEDDVAAVVVRVGAAEKPGGGGGAAEEVGAYPGNPGGGGPGMMTPRKLL